jgi:4-diphosphocytidyl-2-C-methyl-D-erythritol kinase
MPAALRAYAKINIGLEIGAMRPDGYHALRTIYQTVDWFDVVRVEVGSGTGIEIKSKDARVPLGESNTCHRVAERVMKALGARGKVSVVIEKNLPVQGGLGAGSSNGVATMLALERELKAQLEPEERLRIASEVGSDLPLFLVGGLVLGMGRGEEVYPLPDLPGLPLVIATPPVAVSTPDAFDHWDDEFGFLLAEWFVAPQPGGSCNRCSHCGWGPGRGTASRPCPCRDRERLRTRRLSSISRIA